jgi:hypothetical protein
MDKAIISTKSEKSQTIVKEARKKAIDEGISFSDAVILLLEKWVKNEVRLNKRAGK